METATVSKNLLNLFVSVDAQEIVKGVTHKLKVGLSTEQTHLLIEFLDKDGDGQISYYEFVDKINFRDLPSKVSKYTISLKNFTDCLLNEWYVLRAQERQEMLAKLKSFDKD